MELRWMASAPASALHAAAELLEGRTLVDPRLASALAEPAKQFSADLAARALGVRDSFSHLIPLSAGIGNNSQLAETALIKLVGRERATWMVAAIAQAIGRCEAAYDAVRPDAADELELRVRPMVEQWQARGPGLLACARRLTEPDLFVERADVIAVEPAVGGGGRAYASYNGASIEAVLANPHDGLPEVVRLGWLLAQLQLDLPMFQGNLRRQRVLELGALAMLPAVLTAAAEVELIGSVDAATELAVSVWKLGPLDPALLSDWWETFRSSKPAWHVGLAALDRMLPAAVD